MDAEFDLAWYSVEELTSIVGLKICGAFLLSLIIWDAKSSLLN